MTVSNYKVSEETKNKLITAAGELVTEKGIEAVTVRDIEQRAGTVPNAISYHFGGKEGLIDAVWQRVLETWDAKKVSRYYEDNNRLLKTHDGKIQLVTDIIHLFYECLYADGQPTWMNRYAMRNLICGKGEKYITDAIRDDINAVLIDLYKRVTKNIDMDSAQCWALSIISPGIILTCHMQEATLLFNHTIDYAFYRRLTRDVTRNALFGLGLIS